MKFIVILLGVLLSAGGLTKLTAAPRPANHEVVAAAPPVLQWDPVPGALSYEIYFGTDRQEVLDATRASAGSDPPFLGTATVPEIAAPSTFTPGGSWYWRVDGVTSTSTLKGSVLHFSGQMLLTGNLQGPDAWYELADQQPAIDGDAAMVGYPEWVSNSTDNRPGRVTVLRKIPGLQEWEVAQTLNKPAGSVANARFGGAVAIRGNTAWIGAPGDGSVFKYTRSQTGQWTYSNVRLRPPAPFPGTSFGTTLALGDTWLAAGVPNASGGPDNPAGQRGAVDIFDQQTGEWQVRLYASFAAGRQERVLAVRMAGDGNTLAVVNNSLQTPLTRVEIFRRDLNGSWAAPVALAPPDPSASLYFANSISLSGEVLLVGCPTQSSAVPGRIYVFEPRPDLTWSQTWRFDPASAESGIYLTRTAISGNRAALHFFQSGSASAEVALWQREEDASWTPLGTTLEVPAGSEAAGRVDALALSDAYLLQCGIQNFTPRIRVYLHRAEANDPPVFTSQPVAFGEEGRSYRYETAAVDEDPGDTVTLSADGLPAWLAFTPGTAGRGLLEGTPPLDTTGDFSIVLTAADSRGASARQSFTLKILPNGGLPVIVFLSPDQELDDHTPLTLNVVLEDGGPASYQWFANGVLLQGQTSARLTIDPVQASDAGVYRVQVTRSPAVVDSTAVQVVVRQKPDRFGGDWVTLGASGSHSGRYPATLGIHRFVPAWTFVAAPDGSAVNQVATGQGLAFVSFSNVRTSAPVLRALDLTTGVQRWMRQVPVSSGFSPPTYHRGTVYTQRAKQGTDSPDLRAFDAATGNPRWTSPYDDQYAVPYAPAVSDAGVFTMGGVHGGLYGHTLQGARQWFTEAPQRDEWTPMIHHDRLFIWTGGIFEELSLAGVRLWTINTPWSEWKPASVQTVPAAEGRLAAVLDSAAVRIVDLDAKQLDSTFSGTFTGHPAMAESVVHVISPGRVRAFHVTSGLEAESYPTLGSDGLPRTCLHQPVILDDCLLVSSETETWVFDRTSRTLLQRLPAGGPLTYSDGILMAAGPDGVLRAFAVNQPPVLTPPDGSLVWTEDTSGTWTVNVSDPDGDPLQFQLEGQPAWMTVSQGEQGVITLSGMPTLSSQAGDFLLRLRVDDGKSGEASLDLQVRVIGVNDAPTAQIPADLVVDEDGMVPVVNWRDFFDDEEDGAAGLTYRVDPPAGTPFASFAFNPATASLTMVLAPDFAGTVPLTAWARDSQGLETSARLNLVVRPVPDAPRVAPELPSPPIPADGSPVTVEVSEYYNDPDEGDSLHYQILSNDQPSLFSTAEIDPVTGRLSLVWAPYKWGTARLMLRGTDSAGLYADTALNLTLPEPAAPVAKLEGSTRVNRQTGLVEQTVIVRNPGPRDIGGFYLWVDSGPDAVLYNGMNGAAVASPPPAEWVVPWHAPLAAGAEVVLILEFHSPLRRAAPSLHGAVPLNGAAPETPAAGAGPVFAVRRIVPVSGGVLVEFPSEPGVSYQIEYTGPGGDWKACPIPMRAGGTAVQWIDRGPPWTLANPARTPSRFYRVRRK